MREKLISILVIIVSLTVIAGISIGAYHVHLIVNPVPTEIH